MASKITSSSTAEYFSKNLQQVGFSSPVKAVLTTLKEAVDNALDACEQEGILPEITVSIDKVGQGSGRNTDLIEIIVEDNGPGIDPDDLARVFGEYLASSKFGKGQCSRGQQGIGISAAVTWAQLTNAKGVTVISKTKNMRKAVLAQINVDIKENKGIVKKKETIEDWEKPHGVKVDFRIDGRVQLNGDGGILTYLEGTTLVKPPLTLQYKLPDQDWIHIERVTTAVPEVPESTLPHPHTMKLGEFIGHAHLYGKVAFSKFLKTGFSRVSDAVLKDFVKNGMPKKALSENTIKLSQEDFKKCFQAIQATELMSPSTKSVLIVGEEALSKSVIRLGEIDFFSVVTRKPRICDFKPVSVEVAIARFKNRGGEPDDPIQLLRFANRVPLQFDKSACAITQAVTSVNWRSYALTQPKDSLPLGGFVFAVSVVSPFIKFKNASKETIDASDELVEEIRRALMQAGQKLSRHIRREHRESDLEQKLQHIEKFGPVLIEILARITKAGKDRTERATEGLKKLLGRDTKEAEAELEEAHTRLETLKAKSKHLAVLEDSKAAQYGQDEDTEEGVSEGDIQGELPLDDEDEKRTEKSAKSEKRGAKGGKGAKAEAKGTAKATTEKAAKATTSTAATTEKTVTSAKKAKKK